MALDFPNTPTTGAIYSSSPGGPAWQWDGVKWVSIGTPGATGAAGALGGRNIFHNPYFNVQQRGAGPWSSSSGSTVFTADRWFIASNDTNSVTIVAAADADRAVIGDEAVSNLWQLAFTGSSTSGSYTLFIQRSEGVRRFGNKPVTMSFWARATTGNPRIGVGYGQNFGGGGSPSAMVYGTWGVTPALSTTWQRYSFTATVLSTAGKTLGTTAGTDYFQPEFWFSDQGTYSSRSQGIGVQSGTVQLWGMQLEIGSQATPLEKIDYATDVQNCQRFFFAMAPPGGYGAGWGGVMPASGNNLEATFTYPVMMRTTPTITFTAIGTPSGVASIQAYNQSNMATAILMQSNVANTGYGYWNGTISFSADL